MGMFFEVLQAINNPNQQASVSQLGSVMGALQQTGAGRGLNATAMQTVVSALGGVLQPALKQQVTTAGLPSLMGMITQFGSGSGGNNALSSLLTPQLQQQMTQGLAQKTGLDATMLQSMLPSLLGGVMGLLNMGVGKSGTSETNGILNAFLDGDGATDLGDVFKFANRFLNAPQ